MRQTHMKPYKVTLCMLGFLPLIGCVQVPHPFGKNGNARQAALTTPPPARLIIAPPVNALLPDKGSNSFAEEMVKAILEQAVPAVVKKPEKGDWVLITGIRQDGDMVTPNFSVIAPDGKVQAVKDGMPVSQKDWVKGQQSIYHDISEQAAPLISQLLTGLQARQMAADPHSLKNRAARVYFKGVFGAPGDGNKTIAQQFAISFSDRFNEIQVKPKDADYTLECHVSVTKGALGTRNNPVQHVEIVWRITDNKGKEAGKVSQINDVPAHSLDQYWGDIAIAVGEEAAGGVKHVISNYSGRDNKPLPINNKK